MKPINQEATRANALVAALAVALERKGVLSHEEVLGIKRVQDAMDLLISKKVLDQEEVNVLVINYRSFVEFVGKTVGSPEYERRSMLTDLERRFGDKFPKHVNLVKEIMNGKDSRSFAD